MRGCLPEALQAVAPQVGDAPQRARQLRPSCCRGSSHRSCIMPLITATPALMRAHLQTRRSMAHALAQHRREQAQHLPQERRDDVCLCNFAACRWQAVGAACLAPSVRLMCCAAPRLSGRCPAQPCRRPSEHRLELRGGYSRTRDLSSRRPTCLSGMHGKLCTWLYARRQTILALQARFQRRPICRTRNRPDEFPDDIVQAVPLIRTAVPMRCNSLAVTQTRNSAGAGGDDANHTVDM